MNFRLKMFNIFSLEIDYLYYYYMVGCRYLVAVVIGSMILSGQYIIS